MAESPPMPMPAPASVVTLRSGERVVVETGPARLRQLLDGPRPGRVGLKDLDGGWRWVALADVARVEPQR